MATKPPTRYRSDGIFHQIFTKPIQSSLRFQCFSVAAQGWIRKRAKANSRKSHQEPQHRTKIPLLAEFLWENLWENSGKPAVPVDFFARILGLTIFFACSWKSSNQLRKTQSTNRNIRKIWIRHIKSNKTGDTSRNSGSSPGWDQLKSFWFAPPPKK